MRIRLFLDASQRRSQNNTRMDPDRSVGEPYTARSIPWNNVAFRAYIYIRVALTALCKSARESNRRAGRRRDERTRRADEKFRAYIGTSGEDWPLDLGGLTRLVRVGHDKNSGAVAEERDDEDLAGAPPRYRSLLPLRDIVAADKNKLALTETDRLVHPREWLARLSPRSIDRDGEELEASLMPDTPASIGIVIAHRDTGTCRSGFPPAGPSLVRSVYARPSVCLSAVRLSVRPFVRPFVVCLGALRTSASCRLAPTGGVFDRLSLGLYGL